MKLGNRVWHSRMFDPGMRRFLKTSLSLLSGSHRGIDSVRPERVPPDEWKRVLWMAIDLKRKMEKDGRDCLKLLSTKHVTMLLERPHGRFQLSFSLACALLGAAKTTCVESNIENQPNPSDCGRVFSQLSDMLVTHGVKHEVLVKFASNATVPVFSAGCNIYSIQKVLSDLMTLQERFQRLKGLTLSWIGPPISTLNTYLLLCPLFGINIQCLCICMYGSGKMSPTKTNCQLNKDHVKEFSNPKEAIAGSNVITTSMHSSDKTQINMALLKSADPEWVFLHSLPRSPAEVSDEVFNHENNLSWKASANHLYVAMAIVLASLSDYQPCTEMPNFEGN